MKSFLFFTVLCSHATLAQSFQAVVRPGTSYRSLLLLQVGLPHEQYLPDYLDKKSSAKRQGVDSPNEEAILSKLSTIQSAWTKYCMMAYVAHLCVALPLALIPTMLKRKLHITNRMQSEIDALRVGQSCARTLLTLIPFMRLKVIPFKSELPPVPTIWVSNHVSMLDTFVFLASDESLRGQNRRPIKSIYWKGLDANPICKLLFTMAGFIPVDMEANGNGNPNKYRMSSFKHMLKSTNKAIEEGFDIFILPEGQLNPNPEAGLQPIHSGAFLMAKSSNRPIQMVAIHGCNNLWHSDDDIGMIVTSKDVTIKAYPPLNTDCYDVEDLIGAFSTIVGTFGSTGRDSEDIKIWFR